MLDEGTLFSVTSANVTTDAQFRTYVRETYSPDITASEMAELAGHYPRDPVVGSPFETGRRNQLTRKFTHYAPLSSITDFFMDEQLNSSVLRHLHLT
jgi:acetylcholinesterase